MTSAVEAVAELEVAAQQDGVLERAVDDFARRYHGQLTRGEVEKCVLECYRRLEQTARIKQHLPALTYNIARAELARLADGNATNSPRS